MNIALIGATGFVGAAVLQEALNRGHKVTAIVRAPEKLTESPGLTARKTDVYDTQDLAQAIAGHDAVVHAFNPGWGEPQIRSLFIQGSQSIYAAAQQCATKHLLVVGGAGSLFVAPGVQLIDTPQFPAAYKEGAEGARQMLQWLQDKRDLEWSFISPPALLEAGVRSGQFRIGADQLLMNGQAPASISVADLAVAIIDELEAPAHIHKRFTVGY